MKYATFQTLGIVELPTNIDALDLSVAFFETDAKLRMPFHSGKSKQTPLTGTGVFTWTR